MKLVLIHLINAEKRTSSLVILFKVSSVGVPHNTKMRVNWSISETERSGLISIETI